MHSLHIFIESDRIIADQGRVMLALSRKIFLQVGNTLLKRNIFIMITGFRPW